MQSTRPEQVAAELHPIVGQVVNDHEFSLLVDRIVSYRLLDSTGLAEIN